MKRNQFLHIIIKKQGYIFPNFPRDILQKYNDGASPDQLTLSQWLQVSFTPALRINGIAVRMQQRRRVSLCSGQSSSKRVQQLKQVLADTNGPRDGCVAPSRHRAVHKAGRCV